MRIGKTEIKGKLALAPMADITNLPFRLMCRKHGASLAFTEMINAEGLLRGNKRTQALTETNDSERPVGIQIFGCKPERIADAAKMLSGKADLIDINAGCPAHHVTKTGAGSALLKKPDLLAEIVKDVSAAAGIPATVKIRVPPDMKMATLALRLEKAGAAAITVHPRTPEQGYGGKADWSLIKEAKEAVGIPVIGNGDVKKEEDAERMLEETGCDMVMIGRAARDDPRIFSRINRYLETGEKLPAPTREEKIADIREYARLSGNRDFIRTKAIALYLMKGVEEAKSTRASIANAKSMEELEAWLG